MITRKNSTEYGMLNQLIFPLKDYYPKILQDTEMWTICSIEDELNQEKFSAYILKTNNFKELKRFFLYYVTMLIEVQHPAIIKYYGFNMQGFELEDFEFKSSPTMVLEYLSNGQLSTIFDNISLGNAPNAWTPTKKYINLLGIAYALKFVHSKNLVLRSISPKSILLDDHFYPRIGNFFFAQRIEGNTKKDIRLDVLYNENHNKKGKNDSELKFQAAIKKLWIKTSLFQSPEILLNPDSGSYKSDVYSFAILAYLLLTDTDEQTLTDYLTDNYLTKNYTTEEYLSDKYFSDKRAKIQEAVCTKNKRPELGKQIPDVLTNIKVGEIPKIHQFFTKCWSADPSERWSFDEIIKFLEDPEISKAMIDDQDDFDQFYDYLKTVVITESQDNTYFDTLQKAAKKDPDAMYNYANTLYYGSDPNGKMYAQFYYKNAADKGHLKAMNKYGLILYKMKDKMHEESFRYFKMFVDRKIIELIHHSDHTKLAMSIKEAATMGNIYAQYFYGKMLYKGDGVAKNKEEAAYFFKSAADAGLLSSIVRYADMAYEGDGIKINKADAAIFYRKAANSGNPDAKLKFGRMLYEGDNVKRDRVLAAKYIKESADSGNVESMNFYGYILSHGHGVKTDQQEALRYYKMASDRGNVYAMHNYGKLLQKGFRLKETDKIEKDENKKDEGDDQKETENQDQKDEFDDIMIRFEKNICFYKIAADGGDKESMIKYGNALYEEAVKYYTMALK